jgi:hypothetical protein
VEYRATVRALALTAQRALAARADAKQLEAELRQLVTVMAPALRPAGIGPINAAQLLLSWSTLAGAALRRPSPCWPGRPRCRRPPTRSSAIASTGAGTGS